MKTLTTILAPALALAVVAMPGTAVAQRWQSINERQDTLDRRIEQGLRTGRLSRPEAARLRTDLRSLDRLERRYRADGLSGWERNDINRRFDALSARVRVEKHDRHRR